MKYSNTSTAYRQRALTYRTVVRTAHARITQRIRRHRFSLATGFANTTEYEKVRHNVAKLNIFADDIRPYVEAFSRQGGGARILT